MVGSGSKPMVDFYPIVVELDDGTLENCKGDSASLCNTVLSEASRFAPGRPLRLDQRFVAIEELKSENQHREDIAMPKQRRKKLGVRFLHKKLPSPPLLHRTCRTDSSSRSNADNEYESYDKVTSIRGVRAFIGSLLQLGSQRTTKIKQNDGNHDPVSPIPSPSREGTKRYRNRRFHDEYVLTQEIVKCRISTLWECVHRPTGRRFCAKAIDKRCFQSQSDRAMAAREINMHQLILQSSYPCCLPRTREIFADGDIIEPTQQHDECRSSTSSCSESTRGSLSACDDSHWYIVQDFVAGGRNLAQYLECRENAIFGVSENAEFISNELHPPAGTSRAVSRIMQESEVRSLARSLLLALNELHRRSICHNDLHLENILVPVFSTNHHRDMQAQEEVQGKQQSNEYETFSSPHNWHRRKQSHNESLETCWKDLKLCDLGRAFFVDESHFNANSHSNVSSNTLPRHSSVYYTSPEVIRGGHPRLASDMWSVGVILYRCLAGELPFREQSNDQTCLATNSSTLLLSSLSTLSSSAPAVAPPAAPQSELMLHEQLKRDICRAKCSFGQSKNGRKTDLRWSRVSRGAKQFLSALLDPSSSTRMTCDEALRHPWLTNGIRDTDFLALSPPSSSACTNHYHLHPKYSTISKADGEWRTRLVELPDKKSR